MKSQGNFDEPCNPWVSGAVGSGWSPLRNLAKRIIGEMGMGGETAPILGIGSPPIAEGLPSP